VSLAADDESVIRDREAVGCGTSLDSEMAPAPFPSRRIQKVAERLGFRDRGGDQPAVNANQVAGPLDAEDPTARYRRIG
jgi:hypothetical protein